MKIYCTDISHHIPGDCFPLLSEEERFRAEKLADKVRHRFIVSRAFRRRVLGPEAEIETDGNGRPYVKGNPVFFSMSHTGNFLILAVDSHSVGIDAEFMKVRDFAKLSSWFFGECIPDREDFYRCWTRFEASLKLAGQSLFSKDVPEPKYLHSEILGNCTFSVASNHGIRLPLSIKTLSSAMVEI